MNRREWHTHISAKKQSRQISRKLVTNAVTFVSSVWICHLWQNSLKTSAVCNTHLQDVSWLIKIAYFRMKEHLYKVRLDPWSPSLTGNQEIFLQVGVRPLIIQGELNLGSAGLLYLKHSSIVVWQIKTNKWKETRKTWGRIDDTNKSKFVVEMRHCAFTTNITQK